MNYLGAILLVVLFVILLKVFRLIENSVAAIGISRVALDEMRSPQLSDLEKEVRIQKHALRLLGLFFILTVSAALALAIPVAVIWVLDRFSIVSFDEVIKVSLSGWFLVASTLVLGALLWVTTKSR